MHRPLTHDDFDAVFAAFAGAFSDYVVPFSLTHEQLREMMTRRGWVPEASVGVFEDNRLVAFTLNAVEDARAYDTGTGVVRSHRRRGLGKEMMQASYPLLRARGCTEYVLEVIDINQRAAALYRAEGFVQTRGLQCWGLQSSSRRVVKSSSAVAFAPRRLDDLKTRRLWWDIQPSWQNSTRSITRANDEHVTLGDDDGYVIVFPNSGDVPQLAVRREARRRGIGTRLLNAAAERAGKPLRIMNVDDRGEGIAAFLEHCGAARFVRQFEMVRLL